MREGEDRDLFILFPLSSPSTKSYGNETSPQAIHAGIQPTALQNFLCVPLLHFQTSAMPGNRTRGLELRQGCGFGMEVLVQPYY